MYKISLSAVNVPEETYSAMYDALRNGKIGQTELIEQFENTIAKFVGSNYCIAVSNGTMADAVAIAAIKEFLGGPPIQYVIVPALTFIAQPNSVLYNGLKVIFSDVKEDWTIDVSHVNHLRDNSIVFGTDLMGRQVMEGMDIEDACEAFGSRYEELAAGTFGLAGTYSFFPSHTISTGEGGAIVTDEEDIAKLCRSIRAHGSVSSDPMEKFHFPHFGFNARMSSMQAVLGSALMIHIDEYISRRRENFYMMREKLGGFYERKNEEIVPHGYPIEFESETARDTAMQNILKAGIECRKFFSCIPLEEPNHLSPGYFPVAEHISHTHLYVPCHQNLIAEDVNCIINVVCDQKGRIIKSD